MQKGLTINGTKGSSRFCRVKFWMQPWVWKLKCIDLNRQQPSPLLYSIDYSSLRKRVSLVLPYWRLARTISYRPFCAASAICCMLSIRIINHLEFFCFYILFFFISWTLYLRFYSQSLSIRKRPYTLLTDGPASLRGRSKKQHAQQRLTRFEAVRVVLFKGVLTY